jgi:predicted secreted protein
VLVDADPHRDRRGAATMRRWGDVSVYSQDEEETLLLGGVVQRARMQIGLFTVILTLTAAIIVMMVMYNLTLEKTHDLAVLKLMGAPRTSPPRAGAAAGLAARGARLRRGLHASESWCSRCSRGGCSSPTTISVIAPPGHDGHRHPREHPRSHHVMRIDPSRALEG